MTLLVLLGCAGPLPERSALEAAGYTLEEFEPGAAELAETDGVLGLREIRCWRTTRGVEEVGQVCSYRFGETRESILSPRMGARSREGYSAWSMIRAERVLVVGSKSPDVARDVFAVVADDHG